MLYRLYRLEASRGLAEDSRDLVCANDEAAIEHVRRMESASGYEIRQEDRFVARVAGRSPGYNAGARTAAPNRQGEQSRGRYQRSR